MMGTEEEEGEEERGISPPDAFGRNGLKEFHANMGGGNRPDLVVCFRCLEPFPQIFLFFLFPLVFTGDK